MTRSIDSWPPPAVPARQPGWETRAIEVLDDHLGKPFAWGLSDCLILPAELCREMTGTEVFPRAMRTYRSAEAASALLLELGFEGIEAALNAVFRPIPVARARRFDCGIRRVTIADVETVSTFIVLGNGSAVGKAMGRGKVVVPALSLTRTFAIGEPG